MRTVRELLKAARIALAEMENPLLEAQMLLATVLACDKVKLITWPDEVVTIEQEKAFQALVERRQQHEPIAYILGTKEFWSLNFHVNKNTLIPRPDTELLIEKVLNHLPATPLRIIDVGTGSGIIACTLAYMRPMWELIATDISGEALHVAKHNIDELNLPNVMLIQTAWCMGLEGQQYDAIVSNPPYIKSDDPHLQQGDLPFEPQHALVAGPTGLEAFQEIITQAKGILKPGGLLAFEHGYDQSQAVIELLRNAGFERICTYEDLGQHLRVTTAVMPLAFTHPSLRAKVAV